MKLSIVYTLFAAAAVVSATAVPAVDNDNHLVIRDGNGINNFVELDKETLEELLDGIPDPANGDLTKRQCNCTKCNSLCCYIYIPGRIPGGVWQCSPCGSC